MWKDRPRHDAASHGADAFLTFACSNYRPPSAVPTGKRSFGKSACRRFGVNSFADWMRRLQAFSGVEGLQAIRCPFLAMAGAGEGGEAAAQVERYCADVSGPVTRRVFTAAEGVDMHCQLGNLPLSNAVVYYWLDEAFRS